MGSVFMAQLAKDRRNPLLLLLFIVLSILATLLFVRGGQNMTTIAVFSEDEHGAEIEEKWLPLLNQKGAYYRFQAVDAKHAREQVQKGRSDVAVKLLEQDYRLIAASDSPIIQQVDQYVRKIFTQEMQLQASSGVIKEAELREAVNKYLEKPPFQLTKQGIDGNQVQSHNMSTQLMFAFTLLISIFTMGFKVNSVTYDKVSRIWDRMILSPIHKTSMYLGYISYSFFISFFQVIVVLILFKYVFKFDLGHHFGLIVLIIAVFTFGMISLAMLITGFVSKPEQFYAIYPSFVPMIPLISGAYMPPGVLNNPVLSFIADLFPMSHAMDALMKVVNSDAGISEIALQLSLILLIGVVYMGIGINMVERKSVRK